MEAGLVVTLLGAARTGVARGVGAAVASSSVRSRRLSSRSFARWSGVVCSMDMASRSLIAFSISDFCREEMNEWPTIKCHTNGKFLNFLLVGFGTRYCVLVNR